MSEHSAADCDDVIKLAGVLVRCSPAQRLQVVTAIEAEAGATVQPESSDNALIVIIEETPNTIYLTEQITRIQNIQSVLSVALIYHHNDTAETGNKEMAS
ncbi:chaperone NapD [Neiella marina]|uniref:Chaperone NapD n=1 Tax=Neiella holothuriorum TaxID=2870530 RepID=A0ABS7EFH1_9GAMM|nr:chaperone NapD [Neiella holothuriorum]MBW8190970.1 chaperone NapD [Neiella holothuriorum]